jgi:hypothetical protein
MSKTTISAEDYAKINDLIRIGNRAVRRAQEENRQKGVPNVYSFDGILYYELPIGVLSRTDPYQKLEQELIETAP